MSPWSRVWPDRWAVSALTWPLVMANSHSLDSSEPCLALQLASTVVAFHQRSGSQPKTPIGVLTFLITAPELLTSCRPDLVPTMTEVPSGDSMAGKPWVVGPW